MTSSLTTQLTHHAILFVHPERKILASKFWKELTSLSHAHIYHDSTVLDIDTVRTLISWVNSPYQGERTALLSFHTITVPAQNALLKIIEEPREGVRFILITSNKEAILPTLYSRLQDKTEIHSTHNKTEALLFLHTEHSKRMKLPEVQAILARVDESGRKDREYAKSFILSVAEELKSYSQNNKQILSTIEMASFVADPSASIKSVLEYLSLLLPEIKV